MELNNFITEIKENKILWLLEARPGFFAMVEDNGENSYIPVWSKKQDAIDNANDDWEGYNVTGMSIDEFVDWMNELHEDNIGIAISTEQPGQMLPIAAKDMKKFFAN